MKITDKIYIDLETEKVDLKAIARLLTYENPDFFQKMNLGLSTWKTPQTVSTFTLNGKTLEIMRGEAIKVRPLISHLRYGFDHPNHPVKLQYVNNDFLLDEYQEEAVKQMTKMKQGIVHAVTSAGKSLIILKAIATLGQRAIIVVNRKILMTQLLEDINKYIRDENGQKIQAGIIGNGSYSIGAITVGIDKTVSKHLRALREEFGVVILDECHLCPAKTISDIINQINAEHRFGLTGTLRRKDQKEFLIYSTFGTVIATISKEQLLNKNRVVPVLPEILYSDTKFDWDSAVTALTEQGEKNPTASARLLREKTISLDPGRINMVLRRVSELRGKVIVLSRYVDPCYRLQEKLDQDYQLKSGVITGKNSKEAQESYDRMKNGDLQIIFATIGCVSTGVSISDLEWIVLISPLHSNELLLHQIRGRLMRNFEGKTHGTLIYIFDPYIFPKSKLNQFLKILES